MKTTKRRFAAILLALCTALSLMTSCADSTDSKTNADVNAGAGSVTAATENSTTGATSTDEVSGDETTSSEATPAESIVDDNIYGTECAYSGYDTVPFSSPHLLCSLNVVTEENESTVFAEPDTNVDSLSLYTEIIYTYEDWEAISDEVDLYYIEELFDDSAVLLIRIEGSSTTRIRGLPHVIIEDSKIVPVVDISSVSESGNTVDTVQWYITAAILKTNLEGYEVGAAKVEWDGSCIPDDYYDTEYFVSDSADKYLEYESVEFANAAKQTLNGLILDMEVGIINSAGDLEALDIEDIGYTDDDFYEENALILVQIFSSSTPTIANVVDVVIKDGELCPVVTVIYTQESESCDLVPTFFTFEVKKSDISGLLVGGVLEIHIYNMIYCPPHYYYS